MTAIYLNGEKYGETENWTLAYREVEKLIASGIDNTAIRFFTDSQLAHFPETLALYKAIRG